MNPACVHHNYPSNCACCASEGKKGFYMYIDIGNGYTRCKRCDSLNKLEDLPMLNMDYVCGNCYSNQLNMERHKC